MSKFTHIVLWSDPVGSDEFFSREMHINVYQGSVGILGFVILWDEDLGCQLRLWSDAWNAPEILPEFFAELSKRTTTYEVGPTLEDLVSILKSLYTVKEYN